MERSIVVKKCKSQEEWLQLRECFVNSFRNYPLYVHYFPGNEKRNEFLGKYLDACRRVVTEKCGIILTVKSHLQEIKDHDVDTQDIGNTIGGIVFDPVNEDDKIATADDDDNIYWEAYIEHGIWDSDREAFERIRRYEIWEDKTAAKIIQDLSVRPKWDGMFCALDMKYVGAGLGSLLSDGMYDVAASESMRQLNGINQAVGNGKVNTKKEYSESDDQRPEEYRQCYISNKIEITFVSDNHIERVADRKSDANDALILAISHTRLSAEFYVKIGFKIIAMQPYFEDIVDLAPTTQKATKNPMTDKKKLFNVYFLVK